MFVANWLACQLADTKSTCRQDNSYIQMTDANFSAFPHRVLQTSAVDVVGKGSQAVVSRSDNTSV